jgi:hypothetical protein
VAGDGLLRIVSIGIADYSFAFLPQFWRSGQRSPRRSTGIGNRVSLEVLQY